MAKPSIAKPHSSEANHVPIPTGRLFSFMFLVSIALMLSGCAQVAKIPTKKMNIEIGMSALNLRSALLFTVPEGRDPYDDSCSYEYIHEAKIEIRSSASKDYFYVLEDVPFSQGCSGTNGRLKFISDNYTSAKTFLLTENFDSVGGSDKTDNRKKKNNLLNKASSNELVSHCILRDLIPGTTAFSTCISKGK